MSKYGKRKSGNIKINEFDDVQQKKEVALQGMKSVL